MNLSGAATRSSGMGDNYCSSEDESWDLGGTPLLLNAIAFGWTEDGRCGFKGSSEGTMQWCPRPIPSHATLDAQRKGQEKYAFKRVAAGSRHSVFIMINAGMQATEESKVAQRYDSSRRKSVVVVKRKKKILVTGLNQMMLCEDPSLAIPTEIVLDGSSGSLFAVAANNGATYVVTKLGHVISFGNNKFGKLGYDVDDDPDSVSAKVDDKARPPFLRPQRILALARKFVTKIATASHHVLALTDAREIFSWGRNEKGQLGRGFESHHEVLPGLVAMPPNTHKWAVLSISCGQEHSTVLLELATETMRRRLSTADLSAAKRTFDGDMEINYESYVYCFGDGARGQLGSGDIEHRSRPQENFWVTRLLRKLKIQLAEVVCGGHFCLGLVKLGGQLIGWGANDYGQLGLGHQHDSPEPCVLRGIRRVYMLKCGLRHCLAAAESGLSFADIYSWGFNNWGELGLGDTDIRLSPTKISALKNNRVLDMACGDRHSIIVTAHKPMLAAEVPMLRPMFRMLKEEAPKRRKALMKRLKRRIQREGMLHPQVLDDPKAPLPNQAGSSSLEMKNDMFEKGLRYCLDTFCEEFDWRRQALETCFRVSVSPSLTLQSVCLSCSRRCLYMFRMVPYIRSRNKADPRSLKCDCNLTGNCQCRWSRIREAFDSVAVYEGDQCISRVQLRKVLKILRNPFPVEAADIDDAMLTLGHSSSKVSRTQRPTQRRKSVFSKVGQRLASQGEHRGDDSVAASRATLQEDDELASATSLQAGDDGARIDAVSFEKWYRQYYDDPEPAEVQPFVQKLYTGGGGVQNVDAFEDDETEEYDK